MTVRSCRVEDRQDLWWVEHDIKTIVHLKTNLLSDQDILYCIYSIPNVLEDINQNKCIIISQFKYIFKYICCRASVWNEREL